MQGCAPIFLAGGLTSARSPRHEHCLAAPLSSPENGAAGVVELSFDSAARSQVTESFLAAILKSTVRIVEERWFRVHFSTRWVFAAHRSNGEAPQRMLLALDRDRRVIGAHVQTEDALRVKIESQERLTLGGLFAIDGRKLPVAQGDVPLSIRGSDGLSSWRAVLTPPSPAVGDRLSDRRYGWHTRPRFHLLSSEIEAVSRETHVAALAPRRLRLVREYIDSHLQVAMPVKELAALLGISSSYFARSFLRSTDSTPHSYIMQRRVDKARELLIGSSLPLSEIALMTGFADQPHFTRRFSQAFGVPPLRYQRLHR